MARLLLRRLRVLFALAGLLAAQGAGSAPGPAHAVEAPPGLSEAQGPAARGIRSSGGRTERPKAADAVLDLLGWDFERGGPVPLDGHWAFEWNHFLPPTAAPGGRTTESLAPVPASWARSLDGDGQPLPAFGHATYRLTVICGNPAGLALLVPMQHSAVHLYVNERLLASQGRPGATPADARPAVMQQRVPLDGLACPLRIVAHVSNHEHRLAGLVRSMAIGTAQQLAQGRDVGLARDAFALGGMLVMAVIALLFHIGRQQNRSPLWFALFCAVFAVYVGVSGERLLLPLLSTLGFEGYLKLLFACGLLGLATFVLFVHALHPRAFHRAVVRAVVAATLAVLAVVLVASPRLSTFAQPVLWLAALACALWIGWSLVREVRQGHRSAAYLLAGLLLLGAAVNHDLWNYSHPMQPALAPFAMFVFAVAPVHALALRTARALATEELRQLEQRSRSDLVLRATRAGILEWDGISGRNSYSDRYKELLGWPLDTPDEGLPPFRELLHPMDRDRVYGRFLAQLRDRGQPNSVRRYEPMEYRLRRLDGQYIWVHAEAIGVCGADGRTLRFICSFIDISDHKRLERETEAQARLLELQNETLKDNVRLREDVERISRHDLKTPLNSIIAVPRLLREELRPSPQVDELLGIVERAGYRILSMVNLSLDLFKMENGTYIFRPAAVDLREVAEKVWADLRRHAESKQVRCVVEGADRPALARAEELLCYSMLGNLISNAVEASPPGQAVTLRYEHAGGGIQLHIHNQGEVPESLRGRFFRKYATAGKAGGSGLGAYSARLMARVQEGDVLMRSSASAGTTLTVHLRAADPVVAGATPLPLPSPDGAPRAGRLPRLPRVRVLLVDDDEYNLLILRRYLPRPLVVDTAVNGRDALARAREHWPALVIMDLDMPVMGGLEAVAELRALQAARDHARCHLVALSSHDDEGTRRRALDAGFDSYRVKPVTREALAEELRALMPDVDAAQATPPAGDRQPSLLADGSSGPAVVQSPAEEAAVSESALLADSPGSDADDEAAALRALLPGFAASRRELVDALLPALATGQREQLRQTAHRLAGSFNLYGMAEAAAIARDIERAHASIARDALAVQVAALHAQLDAVLHGPA